jgi:transposase
MLDQAKRSAILLLKEEGHATRAIARILDVSRISVRRVLAAGVAEVPEFDRVSKVEPHREDILAELKGCKGNLIRVHEKLVDGGAEVSYQALTEFCRRNEMGRAPRQPSGEYHFDLAEEMQHDTSPHKVRIGDRTRLIQDASLVLCHSRMLFHQYYPTFNRFWCKVFLTEALEFFGGACGRCMIDNTHVVVLQGSGASMIPVPEMEAFAERFGFVFKAHAIGHANRSAHVERNFDYVENNFLAGREFKDWGDLNQQARAWCVKVNAKVKRSLHAAPRDLFCQEQPLLRPLPIWVPTVCQIEDRIVDSYGNVNIGGNRYSVPYTLIGRQLEVHETKDRIEVYEGHRVVASHAKVLEALGQRVMDPSHRAPRGQGRPKAAPPREEEELLRAEPRLGAYLAAIKARCPGRRVRMLRRLLGMLRDYPRPTLLAAVDAALEYGLFDLDRLDRMVLRNVARDFFVLDHAGPSAGGPGQTKEDSHEG